MESHEKRAYSSVGSPKVSHSYKSMPPPTMSVIITFSKFFSLLLRTLADLSNTLTMAITRPKNRQTPLTKTLRSRSIFIAPHKSPKRRHISRPALSQSTRLGKSLVRSASRNSESHTPPGSPLILSAPGATPSQSNNAAHVNCETSRTEHSTLMENDAGRAPFLPGSDENKRDQAPPDGGNESLVLAGDNPFSKREIGVPSGDHWE
jgi:hypothetical protein